MAQQDACTLLDEDHVKVERLFGDYTSAADPARRRELGRTICHELTIHTQIEEEIFYPAFQRASGDTQLVQESRHEHQEAKDLIAKLEGKETDEQLMQQLQKAVEHHVSDERQKMFPKARQAKGLDLMQLGEQLQMRKSELMAAHPA